MTRKPVPPRVVIKRKPDDSAWEWRITNPANVWDTEEGTAPTYDLALDRVIKVAAAWELGLPLRPNLSTRNR